MSSSAAGVDSGRLAASRASGYADCNGSAWLAAAGLRPPRPRRPRRRRLFPGARCPSTLPGAGSSAAGGSDAAGAGGTASSGCFSFLSRSVARGGISLVRKFGCSGGRVSPWPALLAVFFRRRRMRSRIHLLISRLVTHPSLAEQCKLRCFTECTTQCAIHHKELCRSNLPLRQGRCYDFWLRNRPSTYPSFRNHRRFS